MTIDAHTHIHDESLLPAARKLGIGQWILGGISPEEWERQIQLKFKFPSDILMSFGIHPWWVSEQSRADIDFALELLDQKLPLANALGELGLDKLKRFMRVEMQQNQLHAFCAQLELGLHHKKPLVLHVVRAHKEVISELKSRRWPYGGLVHSYSGDLSAAKKYMDLGFLISISGRLSKIIPDLPADKLVVETDDEQPAQLITIAQQIADIRGETAKALLEQSKKNLWKLFYP